MSESYLIKNLRMIIMVMKIELILLLIVNGMIGDLENVPKHVEEVLKSTFEIRKQKHLMAEKNARENQQTLLLATNNHVQVAFDWDSPQRVLSSFNKDLESD